MDVREKLVELVTEFYGCDPMYYNVDALAIADHLIANGVTVKEWISVKDRLPKSRKAVLAVLWGDTVDIAWYDEDDGVWQDEYINAYDEGEISHWMPLPEPPKGE